MKCCLIRIDYGMTMYTVARHMNTRFNILHLTLLIVLWSACLDLDCRLAYLFYLKTFKCKASRSRSKFNGNIVLQVFI